jgi:hypothetical protein
VSRSSSNGEVVPASDSLHEGDGTGRHAGREEKRAKKKDKK